MADHPGIRIGEEYPVLEILATGDQCRLRLPEHGYNGEDRDSPGLSGALGRRYVHGCGGANAGLLGADLTDGQLTLAPPEWQRPRFWEEYFDAVPQAVAEYDRVKAEILAEA
ncbi:hypothetical protein ACFXN2_10300 [Streptomyces kronopolitis]|uniref:hypothetical protein n=1 Tax=Streptomyces kronopolitis TaxID=1612435 RepID=UPI0036797E32